MIWDSFLSDQSVIAISSSSATNSWTGSVEGSASRQYHTYGGLDRILFPTDERAQAALDRVHMLVWLLQDQKLHLAPIGTSPQRILDVGTGTGIWAIDMAYEYPSAQVIGTDLSPIQPSMVPSNCQFEIDDAEQEWAYQSNLFDFIHIRNVNQSLTDWEVLLSEAYRCLVPGGYIELSEHGSSALSDDGSLGVDDGLSKWMNKLRELSEQIGRPEPSVKSLELSLQNVGFVNTHTRLFKWPWAPWPKDPKMKAIGHITLRDIENGQVFHTHSMAIFTRIGGMSTEEAKALCDGALRAIRNPRLHAYNIQSVAWAQKPYAGEKII